MRKHWLYLNYVVRHKWFVLVAGWRLDAPLWRLILHDFSKFLPSEWFPYVEFFYGKARTACESGCTARSKAEFDIAWLCHQHRNRHHWQTWVLRNDNGDTKVLPMPELYILEMLADWYGAGRAITGKWGARDWYLKNRENMMLHQQTKNRLHELLRIEG